MRSPVRPRSGRSLLWDRKDIPASSQLEKDLIAYLRNVLCRMSCIYRENALKSM